MPIDTARQSALLAWYSVHHRQLPWRALPGGPLAHPYAVVVSELMLQQTRVDTVLDYFVRWTRRWPGWRELAAASEDEVLAQWTGLGYYTRARNLRATALAVCAQHGGQLPRDRQQLAALAGLGPYTVGAVLSLAFGQPAALVDGNVARVLSRWHALQADPMQGAGKKVVWSHAEAELEAPGPARGDPASWNQGLMELGATVCTPRQPHCPVCPVRDACRARQLGLQEVLPPPRKRAEVKKIQSHHALLLRSTVEGMSDPSRDLVLLGQRPRKGLWAGLWEPPGVQGADAPTRLREALGPALGEPAGTLEGFGHTLTHRQYAVQADAWLATEAPVDLGALGYVGSRWMPISAALSETSGLSRLGQRLVEAWLGQAKT